MIRDAPSENQQAEERLTEDLLDQLLNTDEPEEYLLNETLVDDSLADYLNVLLKRRGLNKADVVRATGITSSFLI